MSVFVKATASRSRSFKSILGGIAIVGASALVLSGCAPAADTGSTAGPREPLTLKIGTILPQSGTLAFLGPPEEAGVALAVKEINEADLGITVEVEYRDSGDTTTDTATVSVTDLLSLDVSAIVGAASSGVSKTVIDQIVAAGVVQFSPANTSIDFTDYADDGLYWRTAPSDVLQGEVLGNLIAEDGVQNLGIIELNDSYGTGLTAKITETFEAAGGTVVASPLFNTGDTVFTTQISEVLAANPDAIALVTFDEAKIIVPALQGAGYAGPLYFVDGNLADYSTVFAAGALEGDKGTLPGLDTGTLGDFTDRLL
ncbi:MAG: ABC transporter substrate-binding protein, partial [Rhodoglobus sp.]